LIFPLRGLSAWPPDRFIRRRVGELASNQSNDRLVDGERKLVTVLFADIARSTRLIVDHDPEDAEQRLLGILQIMIDAVHRFGGTVNQVLGDGIMALFGVPRAQEDHALRACLAAEAIHAATRQHELARRFSGGALEVRVGLGSGELVVSDANYDLDLKYRVTGQAVYLARRLESAAPPGASLLGRATLNLVAEQVRARPFGPVRLTADGDPVDAFELSAVDLDHTSFRGSSQGDSTSFIGRNRDLDDLHADLELVAAGTGRVTVITGDAGIGKSRLVHEFLKGMGGRGCPFVTCDLLPSGFVRPRHASARIIKSLLPRQAGQGGQCLRDAVGAWLDTLGIDDRYALPAIMEILGSSARDTDWSGLEPPERLQILSRTVGLVVAESSRRKPLVIVFEDFHWADSETQMLVDELAVSVASSRILLLVTCRTHHNKTWTSWPGVTEREMRPLSRVQTSALLEALLGADPDLEELKQLLVDKTQGNPFFLEECVRAVEEAGGLVGVPGAYRLQVPVAELEIPITVHGALAARIDSLTRPERAALLSASVIGQRVDVGLLRDLCPQPREELLTRLSRLQQAGFLERTRIMPNLEYSFRHALIHDVAYMTLLKRKRRELHTRVMAAVEQRPAAMLPCKAELVAHHAFQAENWSRAFAYCRRAGQRAQAKSANREAADFFRQALWALQYLPKPLRAARREIDARLELVESLFPLGHHEQVHINLLRVQELADHLQDKRRRAKAASLMALYHWQSGSMPQAIQAGRSALQLVKSLGDFEEEVPYIVRLGAFLADSGDYESACKLFEAANTRIRRESADRGSGLLVVASVGCLGTFARSLGELGQFTQAVRIGDDSIRIADETNHAFSQIYGSLSLGHVLLRKGDFDRSIPILEHSLKLCRMTRLKSAYGPSAVALGYAYVRSGQVSRGLGSLEDGFRNMGRQPLVLRLSTQMIWLAEALLIAGRTKRAADKAGEALALAQQNGEKGHEAWALWLLGRIHQQLSDPPGAESERCLRAAFKIASSHHMAPLIAHCLFELGKLSARRNSWSQAQSQIDDALGQYRQLEMSHWLELAEAATDREGQTIPMIVGFG
jgi:class 3 adenylate cyclase/tetratricopeptide (TPR) repeat protein